MPYSQTIGAISFFSRSRWVALLLLVFFGTSQLKSQQVTRSKKTTDLVVDSLARQLRKYYVDQEAGVKMSAFIKKRCKEGAYDNISDPHQFAAALSRDVLSVHRDEHFHVEFHPALAKEVSGEVEDIPRMVADKLQIEKNKNYGFKKAEILNGNIGYLEISSFSRLNRHSAAAANHAFNMLGNTDGLIIDLRYGVGGSPDMVTHILSRFFKEKKLVNTIYIRSENATLPYWTQPDSTQAYFGNKPIYILTSYKTFSAAEGLAFTLQASGNAKIVGEKTRGGAHTVTYRPIGEGFIADIPFGKAICPINKCNWEKTGVSPDILSEATDALLTAQKDFFKNALAATDDTNDITRLNWNLFLLDHAPINQSDSAALRDMTGDYGAFNVTLENNQLFYQKAGKARFPMLDCGSNLMLPQGNSSFYIEFKKDDQGRITSLLTRYEDGREELGIRKTSNQK